MPVAESLQLMEYLWENLSQNAEDHISPKFLSREN